MIEFDPAKDAENLAKHGVSLARAADLDLDTAIVIEDDRADYGEARFNAYGLIDGELHGLTFTLRGDNVRVISLRRARPKEVRQWQKRR